MSAHRFIKPRLPVIVAGALAISVGLGSRYGLTGFWAKYLGVAFWATGLYMLILFVRPSMRVLRAASLTLAVGWFVEFAQLTPVPAYLSAQHAILRLIFGARFNPADLPALMVGVGIGAGIHAVFVFRSRRQVTSVRHRGSGHQAWRNSVSK